MTIFNPPNGVTREVDRLVTDQQSNSPTVLTIATCLEQLNFQNGSGATLLGVARTTEIRCAVWVQRAFMPMLSQVRPRV